MGKHATEVPTLANVHHAIIRLKPGKRAQWKRDAERRKMPFEEYVITRISINVEHRKRHFLDVLGTQELEQEVERRKRRKRTTQHEAIVDVPETQDVSTHLEHRKKGELGVRDVVNSPARASVNTIEQDLKETFKEADESCFIAPPSGGEAGEFFLLTTP